MTIKITSAVFSACIVSKDELPKDDLPIVALVGRSNVGKSSLINSLCGRKELARTSSMPGKTLTINFYCINDAFYLVDLPGYGYAKASKATKARIQVMMNEFFGECDNLKGVIQVLDIRHRPSKLDMQMRDWIVEQRFNGFVVLTKNDKLSNQQSLKMRASISKDIGGAYAVVYSSKSNVGKDDFLDALEKVIAGYAFKGSSVTPSRRSSRRPSSQRRRSGSSQGADRAGEPSGGGDGGEKKPRRTDERRGGRTRPKKGRNRNPRQGAKNNREEVNTSKDGSSPKQETSKAGEVE